MLNASVGVQRVLGRLRRTSIDPITAMSLPAPTRGARSSEARIVDHTASTHVYPAPRPRSAQRRRRSTWAFPRTIGRSFTVSRHSLPRPTLRGVRGVAYAMPVPFRRAALALGHERVLGVAVAGIVLAASFLSVTPGRANGDTGGTRGAGAAPRLTVGGSSDGSDVGSVEEAYVVPEASDRAKVEGANDGTGPSSSDLGQPTDVVDQQATVETNFLADGTLVKPVSVDTSVPDGSALMRTYRVRSGDTLASIAAHYDVSTMTLWWANDLKAKNKLVVGQILRIPPVSGLVVEVTAADTLDSLAAKYEVSADEIMATNKLTDRHLVVGQVLMLPGARGAGISAPKPRTTPSSGPRRSGGSSTPVKQPRSYNGGRMLWPTTSRHISQYFHYGHFGIDIDGNTGDAIFAAAGGTVTFAGWKNNGGGYQVWISHGSGLYTTYNHMAGVSVGRGQVVSRGQRVGRMGATGNATGSHLHFEVWRGPIWNGGVRVNPLAYL